MRKRVLSILVLALIITSFFQVHIVIAEEEYNWMLVDVINYSNAETWAITNEHEAYNHDFACNEGNFSVYSTYIGKTEDWRNPPMKNGEGIRLTASFSKPPEIIAQNEEVSISLNLSASDNTLSFFGFSGSASANFDRPDVSVGSRSKSSVLFTNTDGEYNFEISLQNNYETINETLTAKLPNGREEGDRIALRLQFYRGVSMGTYYIYEWRNVNDPIEERPQEPEKKKSIYDMNPIGGNISFDNPLPAGGPSGVEISDMYGEVFVFMWVERGNEHHWSEEDEFYLKPEETGYWAEYNPIIGHDLPINAYIQTRGNSGVILSLRDMTTFVLPRNSTVQVGDQSPTENKLSILAGHVWGKFKQVIEDGSMDMEMSQAVAGIKATTFILEEDGETSTLKVFEGEVEITLKDGGQKVLVTNGEKISASQEGFTTKETFDVNAELSNWDSEVKLMTLQAIEEYQAANLEESSNESAQGETVSQDDVAQEVVDESRSGSIPFVLILSSLLIFVLAIGILFLRRNSKRKTQNYSSINTDNHLNSLENNTNGSSKKYCNNCGNEINKNSKFCTECGQQVS